MPARQILIVHQNFPGQFPFIVKALLARGDKVAAIASPGARNMPGVDVRRWVNNRSSAPGIFPHATRAEADLIRAYAAANAAEQLKRDGFTPDVIIGNPAWGETIHLKEVWPQARVMLLGEFFYVSHGGDVGFDAEFERRTLADDLTVNAKNATQALAYVLADRIVCPTAFQASTFPPALRPRITVHHEGVDLTRARRKAGVRLKLPGGRTIGAETPVITFINRNFERLRGFPTFMRALPALMAACPAAEVVMIGADGVGYGGPAPQGTWRDMMMAELGERIDPARLHVLGLVPHDRMVEVLSLSWAHVYYTYPFVLSWSLVEAMACECLILGSDTAPLHDAVEDGVTGLLNGFFDVDALSAAMIRAVREPEAFVDMRAAARQAALAKFDQQTVGVPGWLRLIDEAIG